ncbi:hypothetical protein GUJ93_ZPchr0010g8819 [Zizania palustris]|uniref:Uncharacterized protein n=1 Tax=Zizania palustris TaxID=103762 RepID=A0A8J5WEZ1_ZIZPA|nr:hypothetical protein GUJ93_ZPchr0010g8819 [Zizania palustris]
MRPPWEKEIPAARLDAVLPCPAASACRASRAAALHAAPLAVFCERAVVAVFHRARAALHKENAPGCHLGRCVHGASQKAAAYDLSPHGSDGKCCCYCFDLAPCEVLSPWGPLVARASVLHVENQQLRCGKSCRAEDRVDADETISEEVEIFVV